MHPSFHCSYHIIVCNGVSTLPLNPCSSIGNDTQEQEPDVQQDQEPEEQENVVANTCVDPGKPRFALASL